MINAEVLENNKLIAEFMGFTYEKNIGWYDNDMNMPQIVYDVQNGNCFNELLFDQSWDWLMPSCKKYMDLYPKKSKKLKEKIENCEIEPVYKELIFLLKKLGLVNEIVYI